MFKIKLYVYAKLEALFETIARRSEDISQKFAICCDCGENRYTSCGCIQKFTSRIHNMESIAMSNKRPFEFKFHTGNVIRNPYGDLEIVSDVHDETIEVIAAAADNVAGVHKLEDEVRDQTCACGDNDYDKGEPQDDCEDCHGTGRYNKLVLGWGRSEVLAPCVQAFILQGTKKAFGFK